MDLGQDWFEIFSFPGRVIEEKNLCSAFEFDCAVEESHGHAPFICFAERRVLKGAMEGTAQYL